MSPYQGEALKAQLDEEYEDLVQNWKLDEDAPVIKSNNKGAYENKWEKNGWRFKIR